MKVVIPNDLIDRTYTNPADIFWPALRGMTGEYVATGLNGSIAGEIQEHVLARFSGSAAIPSAGYVLCESPDSAGVARLAVNSTGCNLPLGISNGQISVGATAWLLKKGTITVKKDTSLGTTKGLTRAIMSDISAGKATAYSVGATHSRVLIGAFTKTTGATSASATLRVNIK